MSGPMLPGMEQLDASNLPIEEKRFFYATSGTNLLGILASGLVRPKTGWPKYAPDFQEFTPGFIPLFVSGAPIQQLDQVTRHDKNDLPLLIEFNASHWRGDEMIGVNSDGMCQPVTLPTIPAGVRVVLVKGVIPLADARQVYFGSKDAASRFASYCYTLSNTRGNLLSQADTFSFISNIEFHPPDTTALAGGPSDADSMAVTRRADAIGGLLAALMRTPGDAGSDLLCHMFPSWRTQDAKRTGDSGALPSDISDSIEEWIHNKNRHPDNTVSTLLMAVLDHLIKQPVAAGLSPESLLDQVSSACSQVPENDRKLLCERLESIRASVLQDQDSQPFFRKGSPVLHGLLLFLLDSEYSDERSMPKGCDPSPQALLIAEIMRGVLNGWSRVPVSMRGAPQAELALGYAMAQQINQYPGSIKLPERVFEWADDEAELAAFLIEVVRILSEKGDLKGLRQMIDDRHAQSLVVELKVGPGKRGAKRDLVRTTKTSGKKAKKTALRITLTLPWN